MAGCSVKRANMEELARYREDLKVHPQLKYLFFELTDSCNMHCRHCGSSCSPENKKSLSPDEIEKVLMEVAERYGTSSVMVCLTGGEPMVHPEFRKIVEIIDRLGFSFGITTNGSLIDETMASFLKAHHLGSITVSLDGLKESHERLRDFPGSYERVLRAVRCSKREGIPVQITTVVTGENIGELDGLYEILRREGVSSWRLINIEPIGRAACHPELMLTASEHRALLNYIREKRFDPGVSMEVTYGCSHYLPEEYEHMVRDTYFLCGAGICVASVLCSGDIFTCLDIKREPDLIQGNIQTDDFCEVWEHGFREFRADRTEESAVCSACAERYLCAGDSAHTWDFTKKEPMLCLYQMMQEA